MKAPVAVEPSVRQFPDGDAESPQHVPRPLMVVTVPAEVWLAPNVAWVMPTAVAVGDATVGAVCVVKDPWLEYDVVATLVASVEDA